MPTNQPFGALLAVFAGLLLLPVAGAAEKGILALYNFEGDGAVVRDRSGKKPALDLKIADVSKVRRADGVLEITDDTLIASSGPAKKINEAIARRREISVEVWAKPANLKQEGPARLLTISKNSTERNFTLGQEGPLLVARFRTTKTDANGQPAVETKKSSLTTDWQHIFYVHKAGGESRLFINGRKVRENIIKGETKNWDDGFRLALGNEFSGGRPWRGSLRQVAIFDRAFSESDVVRRFRAGGGAAAVAKVNNPPAPKPAPVKPAPKAPPAEPVAPKGDGSKRVGGQLVALYDFRDPRGDVVRDRSGQKPSIDLKIANQNAVRRTAGQLEIRGAAGIVSSAPPKRLGDAVRRSNALTIEAWVRPTKPNQSGPARLVSLSGDSSSRNFTLGQDGDRLDVRLRATKTDGNGLPSLASKSKLSTERWTHVAYTREANGRTRLFLDGRENASSKAAGVLANWDRNHRLTLGDEIGGERRTWFGAYRLVALYGRSLSPEEVAINFRAGPGAATGEGPSDGVGGLASSAPHPNEQRFHQQIAPLLSQHCLECHDTANQKGELDLSKRVAALASKTIVAGKADESEVYLSVVEDEMPHKREPLSDEEKAILKSWINDGAHWPSAVAEIDPMTHNHSDKVAVNWVRRLTQSEYIATVKAVTGVDITTEATALLPKDLRADGFSNTAYNLGVDLKHIESYARLAELIVSRMEVLAFAKKYQGDLRFTDKEMGALIEAMGKRLLRGPVSEEEVIAYRGISTAVATAGGRMEEAVGFIVEAMLQSPRFIYRIENQRGDGAAYPVNGWELASRLSYTIWGASPDENLLKAADSGEILDPQWVEDKAAKMLLDPRAKQRSLEFAAEWLNLNRLQNMAPNADKFPAWSPQLAEDMRAESLAFFEDLVWQQKRPLRDLFNAQFTYTTPRLAKHYQLEGLDLAAIETASATQPVRLDLKDVPSRGGILTQGSVLTIGGDEASMVARGLFVLHDVLGSGVKDPPPGTDTTPVPAKPGLSQRHIAAERIANNACGGCHSKFEPLAFGLEVFDGVGAFHRTDHHGNTLRDDGGVLFPGDAKATPYKNVAELMDLLAGSERVNKNLTKKLAQFALGRPISTADQKIVEQIHQSATKSGGTYHDLITAIVTSDLVMMAKTETK